MTHLLQDLRFALRRLRKSPGLTFVAVAVLALGTGATTTVFSVVHGVLLQPLPFAESHRIYKLSEVETETGRQKRVSFPTFTDWRASAESFDAMAALVFDSFNLTGGQEPEQLRTARVSRDFFELFGARSARGRVFTAAECEDPASTVVVLGHRIWQRQFGGREGIVGEAIRLDGREYSVAGVMPPEFDFPDWSDLWMPLGEVSELTRDERELEVYGRLAAAVEGESARTEMDVLARQLADQYPESAGGHGVILRSLLDESVGNVRGTLVTLFGAVGGVLLIVCLNVAALQVVRGLERRRELAVRSALGAGRSRVLRQLLTESLLLAVLGGALGVLFAYWGLDLIVALAPENVPRLSEVAIDLPVLGFALLAMVLTGVFFGLLPAVQSLSFDVSKALKQGASGARSPWRPSVRGVLVVAQVALTLVLLAGAGLLGKSFYRMLAVETGFDVEAMLRLGLVMPPDVYPEGHQRTAFLREVADRLTALPDVESVAAGNFLPLNEPGFQISYFVARSDSDAAPAEQTALERVVTVGYFETLGIPLLAGRAFSWADQPESPAVVVVNQTLARRTWPGRSAVGESLRLPQRGGDEILATVIGVAGDVRHLGPKRQPVPEVYRAHSQNAWNYMNLVVRARQGAPERLIPAARQAVWEIDPQRPLFNVGAMTGSLQWHLERPRFSAMLLGSFALFALALAAVGIYSVMAYSVGQRSREIGIRMALGARRGAVHAMVTRQGMTLALAGVAVGLGVALAVTRYLESLLYDISTTDFPTFAAVSIVLAGAAFLAVHVPAVRASRVDPMAILRDE